MLWFALKGNLDIRIAEITKYDTWRDCSYLCQGPGISMCNHTGFHARLKQVSWHGFAGTGQILRLYCVDILDISLICLFDFP